MTQTNFELIKEFHRVFGRTPDPNSPTLRDYECRLLRAKLVFEEFKELIHELGFELKADPFDETIHLNPIYPFYNNEKHLNLAKIAKECSDLLYVTYGTGAALGLDLDRAYVDVHTSNMSKLDENGQVIRREDGKVLKGPNYKEPDLNWINSDKETKS